MLDQPHRGIGKAPAEHHDVQQADKQRRGDSHEYGLKENLSLQLPVTSFFYFTIQFYTPFPRRF